ncbi:MAG: hypothetical protein HND48_13100 [Chloroflexi bacterium]|nr:hypothetical protein [Chloroflexota bacterium]
MKKRRRCSWSFTRCCQRRSTSAFAQVKEICEELGATRIKTTTDNAERAKLWSARHHAFRNCCSGFIRGRRFYIGDVAVPISAYPDLIGFAEHAIAEAGIKAFMKGHAGGRQHPLRVPV